MLEKIRNHSGKIFIFVVNLFLMMIAIFVIKDKDQTKRAIETQKNILDENSTLKVELQSLKGVLNEINSVLSVEETAIPADESQSIETVAPPADPAPVPAPTPAVAAPVVPAPIPVPATSVPAPVQKTAPSNAKTKTS